MTDAADPPTFEFPEALDLSGEVAAVTGGSRGIGRAIAHGLAAGAGVAPVSRTESDVARVAAELDEYDAGTCVATADVADEASVEGYFATVADELGPASVVVNNTGINPSAALGTPDRVDSEAFDAVESVASKHGFVGLTKSLAPDWAPDVRPNCLAPGYVGPT